MKIHELKIQENYLDNLLNGTKRSEIRCNDRDYQTGDVLKFGDYRKLEPQYYYFLITHIHSGLGMDINYVCLSVMETSSAMAGQ